MGVDQQPGVLVQPVSGAWDEIAEFVVSGLDREAILSFRPSFALQERASELLSKNGQGTLSEDEKQELDEFTRAELFMRLVKAKARKQT